MSIYSTDENILDAAEKGVPPIDKANMVGPLGVCDTATLVFSDIRYRVPGVKGGKVDILRGISGFCRGGRLLALMGASGGPAFGSIKARMTSLCFVSLSKPKEKQAADPACKNSSRSDRLSWPLERSKYNQCP